MTTAVAKASVPTAPGSFEPKARRGREARRETYAQLLEKVKKILLAGRAQAKAALEREEVRTWWEAARLVNVHLRIHKGRARYGEKVVVQLAEDLGVTKVYVYDILRFQRAFPIVNSSLQLTLSHYRALARIENSKESGLLYRKAVREKWTVPDLLDEIRSRKLLTGDELKFETVRVGWPRALPAESPPREISPRPRRKGVRPPLKPRRGNFYTYRVARPKSLHTGRGFYSLDLGFGNSHALKLTGIRTPKVGDILEAIRTRKDPRGDRYKFKRVRSRLRRPKDLLYTYKAFVTDVHDDDTLWADFDLGFRFAHEAKLRFRGIDAPEIQKGKQASDYVKRLLAQVPFVVITISGRDKFGRPLADVFYLKGTTDPEKVLREGIFLNQQLLDLGLARRV